MNLIGSKKIETERLILKPSSMEEQKRLWEILMNPDVNRYYLTSGKKHANEPDYWTWENQLKFYQSKVDNALNPDVFCWSVFLKEKGDAIGQVSAQESGKELDIRDVGWFMDPDYQGCGYATEAARAMIDYMFNVADIKKIESGAAKVNNASCNIFKKLGFSYVKDEEHPSPYTFYDGDLVFSYYDLTKEDYDKYSRIRK